MSKQFDHGKYGFPLTGAHGATTCRACHVSLDFKQVRSTCASCHTDNHNGEFGANCARCHTTRSFVDRDAMAKAHQLTRFPLSGSHLAVDCAACHKPTAKGQLQFVGTPTDLRHLPPGRLQRRPEPRGIALSDELRGLPQHRHLGGGRHGRKPPHVARSRSRGRTAPTSWPAPSATPPCRTPRSSRPATAATTPTTSATTNPSHAATGYSTDCASCHQAGGELGRRHVQPPGNAGRTDGGAQHQPGGVHAVPHDHPVLHGEADLRRLPSRGVRGHHQPEPHGHGLQHRLRVVPPGGGQLGRGHVQPPGHAGGADRRAQRQPGGLHPVPHHDALLHGEADVRRLPPCRLRGHHQPEPRGRGYGTNCTSCHQLVANWAGATFNHPTSPIALTGAHSANLVACAQCHTTMPYSTVKQTCDGCHHADYVATTNPNHTAAGYSTNCSSCHQVVANWAGATFTHPAAPIALTGAHSANLVTCAQCHTTMPYSTVKQTCDGCHHADYVATTNPSHSATGYGTDCASCHQVVANWAGATFNHPATPVALTGVHSANLVACTQCHTTTPYSTVKQTCDGCHHAEYVATTNPNHTAAGYSTNCTSCHQLVANWAGATFNHPASPIALTGVHSGNLVTCTQCHKTMPYSTVQQTCDGCHHADYVATTNPNHTAAGLQHQLHLVPPAGGQLGRRQRESPHVADRADRGAQLHHGAVRPVPHDHAVRHGEADLRRLPPCGLHVSHGSQSRDGQLLGQLHRLSRARGGLDRRPVHWRTTAARPSSGSTAASTSTSGATAPSATSWASPTRPRPSCCASTATRRCRPTSTGQELHAERLRPVRMPRERLEAVSRRGWGTGPGRPGTQIVLLLLALGARDARAQRSASDTTPAVAPATSGASTVYLKEGGTIRGQILADKGPKGIKSRARRPAPPSWWRPRRSTASCETRDQASSGSRSWRPPRGCR